MPLLRLLLAGLVAIAAMLAVVFTAVVVLLTGMAAYVAQLFRPRRQPGSGGPAGRAPRAAPGRHDDVIEVEATKVPDEP